METKERVREALKDKRFKRQPEIFTNCVRVFYAEEDEEKHHVDFPCTGSSRTMMTKMYESLPAATSGSPQIRPR